MEEVRDNDNYVMIELRGREVNTKNPIIDKATGNHIVKVFVPSGGVMFYPLEWMMHHKDDNQRVFIRRKEGSELSVRYRDGNDVWFTEKVKIEELKRQIDIVHAAEEERKAAQKEFVNMTVPTEWGHSFSSKAGDQYISISIPIPEGEGNVYYSFVLPEQRFKPSSREEGMSYFGFPKENKDNTADYTVKLKASIKQEDGSYLQQTKEISSSQLKEYVDRAKEIRKNQQEIYNDKDDSSQPIQSENSKNNQQGTEQEQQKRQNRRHVR